MALLVSLTKSSDGGDHSRRWARTSAVVPVSPSFGKISAIECPGPHRARLPGLDLPAGWSDLLPELNQQPDGAVARRVPRYR